jgi:NAD(P)-dependent dehydrogenase (short-subunit alcohol dehydrogenase family)
MGLPPQTPDEVSGADWRRIVDANLNGSFYCLSNAFR